MCRWLMTAALSEWLNVTELSWIHFKLHWIKASGFKCDSAPRAKTTLDVWHHPRSVTPGNFGGSNLTHVRGHSSAKASVTMSLTVGISVHYASSVCSRVCLHIFCVCFSIEGYFWGSNSVKFRAKFEPASLTRNVLFFFWFCFCKIKILLQNAHAKVCTEVTILPLSRAVASSPGVKKSWERDLKFVGIVWGFTIMSLSNLPATLAGD